MMAAFSVNFDQSNDKVLISQCLQGFRYAVHVTSMMSMQTQRDAFLTSVAKFTYLRNASDLKQKNVDAIKVRLLLFLLFFSKFFQNTTITNFTYHGFFIINFDPFFANHL